ncbi:hypothetical protein [Blastococcus sp. SYSU D00695]
MANARTPGSSSPSPGEGTLGGLLAVLERAEALPPAGRPRPRRAALHVPAGRRGLPAARPVPQPRPRPAAPAASSAPARAAVPAPVMWRPAGSPPLAPPPPARRPGLVRRLALWGAGPDGAHLAWNRPATTPPTVPPAAPAVPRRGVGDRLRRGVHRLARWGAGPTGAYLAWNVPPQPRVHSLRLPPLPRPAAAGAAVVLTELPSIPTIRPAASSPAAALLPAPRPRAAGVLLRAPARPPRASQPRASEPPGWPATRPEPCPALPAPSGWPDRDTPGARSPGRARTRGDPSTCRVRGSPP